MRAFAILACCLAVAGCAGGSFDQSSLPEDQRKLFGRADCRRHADHPDLARDFERVQTVCIARARAAGYSAAASVNSYNHSPIVVGFAQAMTARDVAEPALISCMAEHGYLWKTKAEHEAMCRKS